LLSPPALSYITVLLRPGDLQVANGWDIAGVFVNGLSAVAVAGTLIFTGCQIQDARRSLEATTLYNVEKDYSDVFRPIATPAFQKCFGKGTKATGAIKPPNPCEDNKERAHLYDILSNYRLMMDLESYHSLDDAYVTSRIKWGCEFLANDGSTDTIEDFQRNAPLDTRLTAKINKVCGVSIK
jgi:hypothetical protein